MTIHKPHKKRGKLIVEDGIKKKMKKDTIYIDNSGDITIGKNVIFTRNVNILTHEHYHKRNSTIKEQTEKKGVKISNLIVEDDVYFGINCVITESVTHIPKGTIIAAGAVLTKNPINEYEIWGGVPARKIGERK